MVFDKIIGDHRPVRWVVQFWPVIAAAFVSSLAATWLCKKVAIKLGIVDTPDNLVKTHKEPVAYLGGIGILFGLGAGVMAGLYGLQGEEFFPTSFRWLLGILAGGTIACFIGVIDDIFDIKPIQKIGGQVVAAFALILAGVLPDFVAVADFFNIEVTWNINLILGIPFVVVVVVGATNSLNLLDGLDGLCAGVTAIIGIAMLLLSVHLATWDSSEFGDPVRTIICLGLIGGVFGFLPFNRHPAKIFMGDAGSMLLGFMVAALFILFANQGPRWLMASIIVFGLPILDTATALVRRAINKKPLFVSDRGHIYDQMIDRGIPLKKTVEICYGLTGLYAIIGLITSQIKGRYTPIVMVVVFTISALVIWKKGFLEMEGLRGARKGTGDK
ncbi:MAG: undecaprenyl/decaprenyl-phosphate alpha-N-acetylglucosaminyl 1-phosphate transferase [Planctomycetes bacterium]|nr:undecaprenyl/decaprenyl-phosphate alpha-N-acetylglucosaminyl 1-phosphate transferase [Planctomycetota bacterium]